MSVRNILGLVLSLPGAAWCGEQRRQAFVSDPGWDARNNRLGRTSCRTTAQDFGYSPSSTHAGGSAGEIGGTLQVSAEPAYYALRLPKPLTLKDRLSASGKVAFDPASRGAFLLGFFNAKTALGWRTRNSLAMRLDQRSPDVFHAHMEYCTDRWRAGGDFIAHVDSGSGKRSLKELPLAGAHQWSFEYDPEGNKGGGSITFSVDGERMVMHLDPGHKADGAEFDRFGLLNVMKSSDNRVTCYVDDVTINGKVEAFSSDPGWAGVNNRRKFDDCIVRPRCDFGFSPTHFAGGATGELGGLVFRGDDRYPDTMAYYGDRVESLTLNQPLKASGRVSLTRGISDSTSLLGWFHSELSLKPGKQDIGIPRHFLGVMVEGPSSEGFYLRPVSRTEHEYQYERGPVILPDGKAHRWEVAFDPKPGGREGTITVRLDGQSASMELKEKQQLSTAQFNRFGIVTTTIDGNYQFLYFDDLEYTSRQ